MIGYKDPIFDLYDDELSYQALEALSLLRQPFVVFPEQTRLVMLDEDRQLTSAGLLAAANLGKQGMSAVVKGLSSANEQIRLLSVFFLNQGIVQNREDIPAEVAPALAH